MQRDKETKALAQRLETATGQIGLLDDSLAALKKRSAELTTALSQRDVSLRQLEDRLHAQRGAEGSRGKQAEALQGELAAALGERDALRRECSALRDQSRELEASARARVALALLRSMHSCHFTTSSPTPASLLRRRRCSGCTPPCSRL